MPDQDKNKIEEITLRRCFHLVMIGAMLAALALTALSTIFAGACS